MLHGDLSVGQRVASSCQHKNNVSHSDSAQGPGTGDERQSDSLKFFLSWEESPGAVTELRENWVSVLKLVLKLYPLDAGYLSSGHFVLCR